MWPRHSNPPSLCLVLFVTRGRLCRRVVGWFGGNFTRVCGGMVGGVVGGMVGGVVSASIFSSGSK